MDHWAAWLHDAAMSADGTTGFTDINRQHWPLRYLPPWARPYGRLSRWDRPIGEVSAPLLDALYEPRPDGCSDDAGPAGSACPERPPVRPAAGDTTPRHDALWRRA